MPLPYIKHRQPVYTARLAMLFCLRIYPGCWVNGNINSVLRCIWGIFSLRLGKKGLKGENANLLLRETQLFISILQR